MTGDAFKIWREHQGWNQTQAARYLGTTQANISRWEDGKQPIPGTVDRLTHLLRQQRNVRALENFLYTSLDI